MDLRFIMTVAGFAALVGSGVALSAIFDRPGHTQDVEGLIAAALEADNAEIIDFLPVEDEDGSIVALLPLCLEFEQPVRFEILNNALAEKKLRATRMEDCRIERHPGDGMFLYFEHFYDSAEERAAGLRARYYCQERAKCFVEIDGFGAGYSYELVREDGQWRVADRKLRWIV